MIKLYIKTSIASQSSIVIPISLNLRPVPLWEGIVYIFCSTKAGRKAGFQGIKAFFCDPTKTALLAPKLL